MLPNTADRSMTHFLPEVNLLNSKSRYNRRKFGPREQELVRDRVKREDLKCGEVIEIRKEHEDGSHSIVPISESSVRRIVHKNNGPYDPSMVAARPKAMRVGGGTVTSLHEGSFGLLAIPDEATAV